MPTQAINLEARIKTLNAVLTSKDQTAVDKALRTANGDMPTALASLKDHLSAVALQKVTLAHSLAVWSDDHVPLVKALTGQKNVTNLRDVALHYNVTKLAALVDPKALPETTPGADDTAKRHNFALGLRQKLFAAEPTAVLQQMVQDAEVPIADPKVRTGITKFLSNQPAFNIRTTSIYSALNHPEAFKGIAEDHQAGVVEHLKTLQRVQALSPIPESVPVLMKANLTSAFQVAQLPESTFLRMHSQTLGEDTAKQIYTTAINTHIRHEQWLMATHETMRGPGIAIMSNQQSMQERMAAAQDIADQKGIPLNLEALFGSMDFCECEECTSVYSPAAYFVELLQFLRNNNLGPDPTDPNEPSPGIRPDAPKDISNTPLEKLFRRRPDLGCLELTCANTNTVLPYIDLVNEVMESFVVHLDKYESDAHKPKQATLEVFNIEDEASSELLAQPQHINYEAYCILKSAVYPFTLPYHQPIDAIRIFLNYLGTSRYELQDTYRSTAEICTNQAFTPAEQKDLVDLHKITLDHAADAEFLGLTQEEYIILTQEAFWPKRYFDITLKKSFSKDEYRANIGVKPVHEYYGYTSEIDMLNRDEGQKKGLTFVKQQFLPRTGIQYVDLVEMLKTRFINPNFPQGQALTILESIQFSYRYLQTLLVDSPDQKIRFAKLIEFLEKSQPLVQLLDAMRNPDPCHSQKPDACMTNKDLRNWVYCYFERIGKLIVLESGEGPTLPIEGQLLTFDDQHTPVGLLHKDGTIVDKDGVRIGNVTVVTINNAPIAGPVNWIDGKSFVEKFGHVRLSVNGNGAVLGFIDEEGVWGPTWRRTGRLTWRPAQDTCDLDKVRLTHLDGLPVTVNEYDHMQRFIRLWHKLGWTIDETDKALIGLAGNTVGEDGGTTTSADECQFVSFDVFKDDCPPPRKGNTAGCDNGEVEEWICPDFTQISYAITPAFLHQLVAVRKLLDLSGLPLIKLLTFWADISTDGEKSLYTHLFLTHNLLGIDKVFKADANGNYLTQPAKISEHLPVLMAALKLKADDITALVKFLALSADLTLPNVSLIYRHSLLAKTLHVKMGELPDVLTLFGNPFKSAWETLTLLENWGKMEDAGFTFRQLNYLISNHDDATRPLAPAKRTILQITKTLYDGLNVIERDHPDVKDDKPEEATAELIRAKAGLIFDQTVVEQILGLLEGTTVYTTNAPANQTILIPEGLAKKLNYNNQKGATPPSASIQVTGILTEAEKTQAKALVSHPEWAKAIDRVGKQTQNVFHDALSGIFPEAAIASANEKSCEPGPSGVPVKVANKLLEGDTLPPDGNSALDKRFYFLQHFLPFLRQQLSHRLITNTLAGALALPSDVTDLLLSDLLHVGADKQPAIHVLEGIKTQAVVINGSWRGYLIPPAEGVYTFIAIGDTQPAALLLDGTAYPFKYQQEDPSNVWSTDPTPKLKSGKLYWLEVSGQSAEQLQWKTATVAKTPLPTSALLPDAPALGLETEVFTKLAKAALIINGFGLSVDEVSYWQSHATDFDQFDFNAVTLQHWLRLQSYAALRNSLPKTETTLLELFAWANKPTDVTKLSAKIATVTLWKQENLDQLITSAHFDLNHPAAFRNEVNLVKLQKALLVADKIGMEIDRLFEWAKPSSQFWLCHQIAEAIRKALRARYDQEDWEQVVKPLNDQLREHQKQALISYLLMQPDLIEWAERHGSLLDADSLFEFFLIDVQMDACLETSRIKQAISTVQLFVQRCLLGLEEQDGVSNAALDRDRWEWMQKYRVWEANRKVFLYPENWIEPSLRDDKSPFYKELESELLQKDINQQTVEDAMKSYLFKVDEVANLKVVGLFLDQDGNKLHIFARTRNAPYFFYYRYFHTTEKNWYPWEKVQVDIPSYDVENDQGEISANGTYLIPVVWNRRQLLFFPQFVKKTVPVKLPPKIDANGENPVTPPTYKWEVKMGWSEYRNGKWTQKQLSTEAIYHSRTPESGHSFEETIASYEFIPRVVSGNDSKTVIDIYEDKSAIGAFHFAGSQLSTETALVATKSPTFNTNFHYATTKIHSLQAKDKADPLLIAVEPFFEVQKTSVMVHNDGVALNFYHPFAHDLLGKLMTGNLGDLFDYYTKLALDNKVKADAYGGNETDGTAPAHELKGAYSLYNWEAGFHAPMLLVDCLLKSQQFAQALKICHYVFNPLAKGPDPMRFWQFPPFKINAENVLEKLFMGLQPNTPDAPNGPINEWLNHPFQPHVIARSRPSAYMKWVVMKYIEILIAYGDYYFRQNTLEAIPTAIQYYVLAAHIYGPRGQEISKRGKIQPQSYNSLLDKWDAFGNAMVELELVFPFSNQTSLPSGASNGVVGAANIFGFATSLYFCIPDNPKLRGLRDTIDDRLFKIRHCQDIDGVVRHLPLFEPPIDPALLVQAAAQGLSLSSVLNDLNSPMPNYRFYYLLQKALELCTELKAFGNAFLSVKEKGDAEVLSKLRAGHESSIHNLVMEVKKQQLEEAGKSLEALQQSRKGPVYRLQHYLKLIGEDLGKVPDDNTDFGELPNQIEQPIDESGLKLTQHEKDEMDKASAAADWQTGIGIVETLASVFHALPTMTGAGHPLGVGLDVMWGFPNLANATSAVARGLRIEADHLSHKSSSAARKGGFLRQLQDRVQQANVAGYEIKNIDKQVLTQQIRINIASQEITNQQKQMDNAQAVEEYLRNKYTNQELYVWMEGQIQTLYHQAYTLAYDLAKKAEKVFRFERGRTTSNFIQFGYWDTAYDGLLAGERMYIGLKQLEAAYLEKRGYDFEVSKHISLRQVNPLALLQLKETGTCEFALPEVLFDMDHPGHFMRRIKSVALTVPCVVGPYTSLNCTLRLLEHKFRTSAANGANDYPEKTDATDERFSTVNVPITAIAISSGQNDSGVFELNFKDERYIPFEGAGVISKWRLELPEKFRQFDYDSITDVVMQIRYTAVEGGDKLKGPAADSVQAYIESVEELSRDEGLFALFDLRHDFPNEWYKAMQPIAGATERLLLLNNLNERLPVFTKGRDPAKIQATDVYLFSPTAQKAFDLTLAATTQSTFAGGPGPSAGTMKSFVIKDNVPLTSWQLKIQVDSKTPLEKLWLLVRYVLPKTA